MANGDGSFRILNKFSNKVLDVKDAATAEGASIQQWAWGSTDNQRWLLRDQGAVSTTLATANTRPAAPNSYPSPVTSRLTYQLPAGIKNHRLTVIDTAGRQVLSKAYVNNGEQNSLDVSELKSGLYVVRISSPSYNSEFRINKQ